MTGSEMKLTSCSRQVSSEKATPVGQPKLWLYPKVMVAKGYAWILGPSMPLLGLMWWLMPRVRDIFTKLGKAKFFTTLDLR